MSGSVSTPQFPLSGSESDSDFFSDDAAPGPGPGPGLGPGLVSMRKAASATELGELARQGELGAFRNIVGDVVGNVGGLGVLSSSPEIEMGIGIGMGLISLLDTPERPTLAKAAREEAAVSAGVAVPASTRQGQLPPAGMPAGRRRLWEIKKASVRTYTVVEGAVVYAIEVRGLEGRVWTVQRSLSEFQRLESTTWKIRGPMPACDWAGTLEVYSIWMRLWGWLDCSGSTWRSNESRLLQRLNDWLERLVQRARSRRPSSAQGLQEPLSLFLDVAQFKHADSNLLLLANNVTSLVSSNPRHGVEQILLKLASEVEHVASTTGKRALDLARRGPLLLPPQVGRGAAACVYTRTLTARLVAHSRPTTLTTHRLTHRLLTTHRSPPYSHVRSTHPPPTADRPARYLLFGQDRLRPLALAPDGQARDQQHVDHALRLQGK